VTLGIIQLLIDEAPASVRTVDRHYGHSPLHILCKNNNLDETAAMQILRLLIESYPEAVRRRNNDGALPIHDAASWTKSSKFCSLLIEAYPESE